jgi:Tol biopolymer transport system component
VAAVVAVLVLAAAGCDTGADTSTGSPPTVTAGPETNEVGQEPNEVAAGSHTIPDKPGVYLFDLETREATRLPDIVTDWPWIIVSHNGTMIAYPGTDPDGRYVIDVADIDGTDIRSLESTAAPGSRPVAPDFSPDGSQIVYQLLPPRGPVGDLFVVDLATGKTTQLTHLPPVASDLWDMHPIFSPDGTTVLFNRPRFNRPGIVANQHWDLWSVPAARGEPRLVVRNAVDGRFSPDGRMIAYVEPTDPLHPFGGDLWLADADGTDVRRLERGKIVAPQWSPDGTKISYGDKGGLAYGDKGRHGSFVIDVATGVTTEVLGRHYRPEWVDGQTWIVVVCRGQCP